VNEKQKQPHQNAPRWPFDPMQPGDHEPVEPTGAGDRQPEGKDHD
jgi:hypothetical protein